MAALPRQFDEWQIELHGRRAVYRVAGSGPPVVLIHGMLNSSSHWQPVALNLAGEYTVIAPDLIGHGDSAAPRGDYSLGAHAASIRDLLAAVGIDRATIVGHSLGGGVAMQFFYQFPQRVERLVLISSGGLGHEVSPMLRTAALPGTSALLSATIHPRLLGGMRAAGHWLSERGDGTGVYLQAIARALSPLENRGARAAFLQTLRAVIDVHGQRVSAERVLGAAGVARPLAQVSGAADVRSAEVIEEPLEPALGVGERGAPGGFDVVARGAQSLIWKTQTDCPRSCANSSPRPSRA